MDNFQTFLAYSIWTLLLIYWPIMYYFRGVINRKLCFVIGLLYLSIAVLSIIFFQIATTIIVVAV